METDDFAPRDLHPLPDGFTDACRKFVTAITEDARRAAVNALLPMAKVLPRAFAIELLEQTIPPAAPPHRPGTLTRDVVTLIAWRIMCEPDFAELEKGKQTEAVLETAAAFDDGKVKSRSWTQAQRWLRDAKAWRIGPTDPRQVRFDRLLAAAMDDGGFK